MKTYNAIVLLLLSVSVGVSIISFIYLFYSNPKKCESEMENSIQLETLTMDWSSDVYYRSISEGKIISNASFTDYLEKNGLVDQDVLVVKYSNLSCNSCLDYLVEQLNDNFSSLFDNRHILFVASDYKGPLGNVYGQTLYLPYGESLELELEESNIPFMFVYRGQISSLFAPSSSYQLVTDTYFSSIKQRYKIGN